MARSIIVVACLLLCGLIGCSRSQGNTANELLQKVSSGSVSISELKNLEGQEVPSIDDLQTFLKMKCEQVGGPSAAEKVELAFTHLQKCVSAQFNQTAIQSEIDQAMPKGDLDIVFKRLCSKMPSVKGCMADYMATLQPCMDEPEREASVILRNVTDFLLDFACFKEGDRIALFIASGGPDCIASKQQQLFNCFNKTLAGYTAAMTTNASILQSTPTIAFSEKECSDFASLQSCVVKELEKCSDPTPANIVDSIMSYVQRATPCSNYLSTTEHLQQGSGSSNLEILLSLALGSVLVSRFL